MFCLLPARLFCAARLLATSPAAPALHGSVADPKGGPIAGAEIDLVDTNGAVAVVDHSGDDGSFQITAPHAGSFTLVVSGPGFETVREPVAIAVPVGSLASASSASIQASKMAGQSPASLRIVLPIAQFATNIQVNAENSEDLTASDVNRDSSVMTAQELKQLPIFDNDYAGR